MKPQDRKDYFVTPFERNGEQLWAVRISNKSDFYIKTICRTEEAANEQARLLNLNPWHYESAAWKEWVALRNTRGV